MGEVEVYGKRPIATSQTLRGADLRALSTTSVADALKYFAGVQMKDYGGLGGLKTINVRSMGAQHVGIYIDGTQAEATALWRQACNEMLLFNWADTDIDISAETSIYITLALVTDKPGGNPVINRQHITFPEMYYHFVTASMTPSLANNVLAYNRIKTLIDQYNSPYEGGKYKRATIDDVFRASREDAISLFEELYNELINYPWKRVDITLLKDSRFTLILAYGSGRNMNTVISREVILTDNTPSW